MTKFERDKVYKTRDGQHNERVIWDAACEPDTLVCVDDRGRVSFRRPDGKYFGKPGYDLMLPKPEPIVEWGLTDKSQWSKRFIAYDSREQALSMQALATRPEQWALAKRVTEIVE